MLCLATIAGRMAGWRYCSVFTSVPHTSLVLRIDYRDGVDFSATWPVQRNSVELPAFGGAYGGFGAAYENWVSLGEVNLGILAIGRRRDVPMAQGKFASVFATQTGESVFVWYPKWFPFLAAVVSALLWRRSRRQALVSAGLCLTCGYDLRASRIRCPECGTPIGPFPTFDVAPSSSAGALPISL